MKAVLIFFLITFDSLLLAGDLGSTQGQLFKNIDHMEVDFQQVIYKKLRNRKIKRSGKAYFSKPKFFRWNFQSKELGVEEFYYNGKILTHFRESENLVTNYRANVGLARELDEVVKLVLDPQALKSRYEITDHSSSEGFTHVSLKPKAEAASDIHKIQIKVSEKEKYVQTIKIDYMDENYTQFSFKNPKFAPNSKEIFSFSRKGAFTIRDHG